MRRGDCCVGGARTVPNLCRLWLRGEQKGDGAHIQKNSSVAELQSRARCVFARVEDKVDRWRQKPPPAPPFVADGREAPKPLPTLLLAPFLFPLPTPSSSFPSLVLLLLYLHQSIRGAGKSARSHGCCSWNSFSLRWISILFFLVWDCFDRLPACPCLSLE
jgi:hypothetical protein